VKHDEEKIKVDTQWVIYMCICLFRQRVYIPNKFTGILLWLTTHIRFTFKSFCLVAGSTFLTSVTFCAALNPCIVVQCVAVNVKYLLTICKENLIFLFCSIITIITVKKMLEIFFFSLQICVKSNKLVILCMSKFFKFLKLSNLMGNN
jgi:hypothetical protein